MKRITVWHRQLSSQCLAFLQVVCAGGCLWESSPSTACGHPGQKWMHPDKCVQKVTLRHLFLNSLTLAAESGKKGSLWHPLLAASPGGIRETNARARTQIKRTDSCQPLACAALMTRGGHRSREEEGPLESGTAGRKETTHWSRVTTFCLFFSFLCWLHV